MMNFEIKEVNSVEATGARLGAFAVSGISVLGGLWLIGAAFAC